MADEAEKFLRRWSQLKRARENADLEGAEATRDSLPGADATDHPAGADNALEPSLEEADLPDIEGLDKDSDYTAFLKAGVPETLRRLALRKLWLSDPVLANLDGLNDYDENFAALFESVKEAAEVVSRATDSVEKSADAGVKAEEEAGAGPDEEGVSETEREEPSAGAADDHSAVAGRETAVPQEKGEEREAAAKKSRS